MSGAGENRWRRPGQPNRGQNADARSGSNTPTGRGQPSYGLSGNSGNVWGGQNIKGKAGGVGQNAAAAAPAPGQAAGGNDFNAAEVREFLKKKYLESVKDQPSVHYKVQGDSVSKRSSGAWGSRGNMSHLMPSGQDFFAQLKKQLVSLEQQNKMS